MKKKTISYKKTLTLFSIYFFTINLFSMEEEPIKSTTLLEKFKINIEKKGLKLDNFYILQSYNKTGMTKYNYNNIFEKLSLEDYSCMPRCVVTHLFGSSAKILNFQKTTEKIKILIENLKHIPGESWGVLAIRNLQKSLIKNLDKIPPEELWRKDTIDNQPFMKPLTEDQMRKLPYDTLEKILYGNYPDHAVDPVKFSKDDEALLQAQHNNQKKEKLTNHRTEVEFYLLMYTGRNFDTIDKDIMIHRGCSSHMSKVIPYLKPEIIQILNKDQIEVITLEYILEILPHLNNEQFQYISEDQLKGITIEQTKKIIEYIKYLNLKSLQKIKTVIENNNNNYGYNCSYKEIFELLKIIHTIAKHEYIIKSIKNEDLKNVYDNIKKIILSHNTSWIDLEKNLLNDKRQTIEKLLMIIVKETCKQKKNFINELDENTKNILLYNYYEKSANFNRLIKKYKYVFAAAKIIIKELKQRNTKMLYNDIDEEICKSEWIDCNAILKNDDNNYNKKEEINNNNIQKITKDDLPLNKIPKICLPLKKSDNIKGDNNTIPLYDDDFFYYSD